MKFIMLKRADGAGRVLVNIANITHVDVMSGNTTLYFNGGEESTYCVEETIDKIAGKIVYAQTRQKS